MRNQCKKGSLAMWAFAAFLPPAFGQSSVHIYGVLDAGYQRNNNVLGSSTNRIETRHEPSYIGFRGEEDLGGGLKADFRMEGSVSADAGGFTGFNRQSFIGISDKTWGGITLGRQYDPMAALVGVDAPRFNSVSAVHVGNWDRTSGQFINNMLKYRSPVFGGLEGSLIYSFKQDGSAASNSGKSFGGTLTYIQSGLRISAAYLRISGATHRPFNDFGASRLFGQAFSATTSTVVTDDRIWGIGAYYDFSGYRALGQYTNTSAKAGNGRSEEVQATAFGLVKNPTGTGFRPSIGVNYSKLNQSTWTAVYAIADYYLSRRTDVYVRVVSQRASGPNQRAALYLEGPASGNSQTVFGIGLTHRF